MFRLSRRARRPSPFRKRPTASVLDQDFDHHVVTAVIVSHDGARWLPKTLSALREQTCPLQRVVAADTGSTDNSADILADHLPTEAIVALPANTGYGDAVRAALELPRSSTPVAGTDHEETTEWLWLIHDDFAPETDALAQLLRAADKDPRAAVLGPKLRDWFDRRLLVEVGVTIDGAGRRETGLEQREFDHGQHDGNRHVLAVSSAGMLIRRDVWDRLGGFDPSLPLFRDDIDFCWRVGGAGLRVLLVTDAVAHHAEASSRRRRPISATRNHPRRVDRRHAVFVLLANLPFGGMVTALLRNSVASWLRVLMYLLIKQPANALDEAAAIVLVYLRPDKLIRARFRRRRDRRRTYSAIRPFLARGIALRQFADAVTGILSGEPVRNTPGRHQAVTAPPGPEDEDEALADDTSFVRRVLLRPGVLLVLSLVVVTLVAERSLLFGDLLAGGALPPVAGNAGDLWSLYLASYPDSGIGSDSPVPTYVGFLALLSTVTFGKPWLAVTLLLLGCVPLAGWTAHLLAREVLRYVPARLWLAATYALLPVATGAVAQGRLGTALVHALIPVLGLLLVRMVGLPPKQSRRAAWGLGLTLAMATAFVPMVWLMSLVTGVLVAVAFGHVGRRLYVNVALSLGLPVVLLLPWSLELLRHPTVWLLEAGLHRPELSEPGAAPSNCSCCHPVGKGTAGLGHHRFSRRRPAGAAPATQPDARRRRMVPGPVRARCGALDQQNRHRALLRWPSRTGVAGVAMAFAASAVLLSAGTSARAFGDMVRIGGPKRYFALGVIVLALATPVSAAAMWIWEGVEGPVTARATPIVPGALESLSADGTEPRTLVVTTAEDGAVDYTVVRGREPRLGEEGIVPENRAREVMDRAVAELSAGQGGDQLHTLIDHGIQYVLYPGPEVGMPSDATMVDVLDGTPGLTRQSLSDHYGLWRVAEETGALRVVPEEGIDGSALEVDGSADDMTAHVGEGNTGRRLALAEPADGSWRATLDGTELTSVDTENGTQAWDLPVHGGELRVWYTDHVHTAWVITQAGLFLVVTVIAAPGVRTEEEDRLIESTPAPLPRRPRGLRRPPKRRRAGSRQVHEDREVVPERHFEEQRTEQVGRADREADSGSDADAPPATTTGSIPVYRGGRRRGTRRKPGRRRAAGRPKKGTDGGSRGEG